VYVRILAVNLLIEENGSDASRLGAIVFERASSLLLLVRLASREMKMAATPFRCGHLSEQVDQRILS